MKIKQLFITSLRDFENNTMGMVAAKEVPIPEPAEDKIRIKIQYASICGSDTHILTGDLGELAENTKRMLPMEFGADYALDPRAENAVQIANEYAGGGYDCVLEGTGAMSAANMTLDLLAPDGDAVYFAMYGKDPILGVNIHSQFYWDQKHLHGMKMGACMFPKAIKIAKHIDLKRLIQRIYPLSQYEKAFEDLYSKRFAKIAIEMEK